MVYALCLLYRRMLSILQSRWKWEHVSRAQRLGKHLQGLSTPEASTKLKLKKGEWKKVTRGFLWNAWGDGNVCFSWNTCIKSGWDSITSTAILKGRARKVQSVLPLQPPPAGTRGQTESGQVGDIQNNAVKVEQ